MKKDYKEATKRLYEKYAKEYEQNTKDYLKHIQKEIDIFLENLEGKKILDVGSGPGRDSIYFKNKGFEPLCIDFSEKMIEFCRKTGLNAKVMDIERMTFPDNSFDGVWAYTSLLHVPKKKMKDVIKRIFKILKPKGIFFIGMKEGSSEELKENKRYIGEKRFVAKYTKKELKKLLSKNFEIMYVSRTEFPKKAYINIICKSKK